MKIKRFSITNLYGYLNKDIEFHSDMNLLVGINGAGKTSILNIITWILAPNLPNLCVIEFEEVVLEFNLKGEDYLIRVTQDHEKLILEIEYESSKDKFTPLTVFLETETKFITANARLKDRYIKSYRGLNPDKQERKTWSFLTNEIPRPVVIGLDRNYFPEDLFEYSINIPEEFNTYSKQKHLSSKKIDSPISVIKELTNKTFSVYRNQVANLSQILNNNIILSSIEHITPTNIDGDLKRYPLITSPQIDELKSRIFKYLSEGQLDKNLNVNIEYTFKKFDEIFERLKSTIAATVKINNKDRDVFIGFLGFQYRYILKLVEEFETFDKKSQEAFSEIRSFLDCVNLFLKDSAKKIEYNSEFGELVFSVLDRNGNTISKFRDLETLSSGEKQILILFALLKFSGKEETIYIVDEPELSLHPKWQSEFLDALMNLTNGKSQILIATHSPDIVGKNQNYCTVLLPYN